jgi:hypothetical protein
MAVATVLTALPAAAGEFVMKAGKGYGICEALKRNLAVLKHDRAQLCERRVHPSISGFEVLAGQPLDPSKYADFLIDQLDAFEKQMGHSIDRERAGRLLGEAIGQGRVHMAFIDADVDNDGKTERWFLYRREAPQGQVDRACGIPRAVSQVFLLNQAGDAFDYTRMRGLAGAATRVVRYGKRTYLEKEFPTDSFGVYQETAAGFVSTCVFSYRPIADLK